MIVTGFDLDMTLIDSRPGIKAVYEQLARETGVFIDTELVVSRLGPPLVWELANWFDEAAVPEMTRRYREIYPDLAVSEAALLPGAADAVARANDVGRVLVITAKLTRNAQLHLDALGLQVDALFGDVWRGGKAEVLAAEQATLYVGDHIHDMTAATMADVIGIGVPTGPCSATELQEAGATAVIDSLVDLDPTVLLQQFSRRS